jgi:ABC-2 type transport system permease protein
MRIKPISGVVLRQFFLFRGSPVRVFPMFAWVAIDIVMWGFISRYLNTIGNHVDFVPQLLGAVLLWDFLARVMQGVSVAFLEDVWSRNFLNVFASPLTIAEYVAGMVITGIATSIVGLVVMLALATSVFGLSFFSLGIVLAYYLLLLMLFGIVLGILASAMVLRWGPVAEWLIWPIPALAAPFVGVFYPVSTLPQWMQMISYVLPPSYVFESLRAAVAGTGAPSGLQFWACALTVIYVPLSALVFVRVYRRVVRSGQLARYSAEAIGAG